MCPKQAKIRAAIEGIHPNQEIALGKLSTPVPSVTVMSEKIASLMESEWTVPNNLLVNLLFLNTSFCLFTGTIFSSIS